MKRRKTTPQRRPGGPNESLHERRRRELIAATMDAIAAHGLGGTTVARVAECAGLSVGIISFYFANKAALLLATLQHLVESYERAWRDAIARAGDDPARQLEALIDATFEASLCNVRTISVWNAFWGEASARSEYLRVCGQRDAEFRQEAHRLISEIAKRGDFSHVDPDATTLAFVHLIEWLPEWMLGDEKQAFDLDWARLTCRRFLSSVFPGQLS
ncbi:MAG TPA: TetR/AcrR family transcriptional regulator [Myxococcota bacterium]